MKLNEYLLKNKKLYLIANPEHFSSQDDFLDAIAGALKKGADILELQTKNISPRKILEYGKKVRELCSIYNAMLIIQSRADIGHILQADGIKLEHDDIDIKSARHLIGAHGVAGMEICTKSDIKTALDENPDFLTISSKITDRELFKAVCDLNIPLFSINKNLIFLDV